MKCSIFIDAIKINVNYLKMNHRSDTIILIVTLYQLPLPITHCM